MHKIYKFYYFINEFNSREINKIDPKISLIYREYNKKINTKSLNDFKNFCFKQKRELFISNNIKLALKLQLSGVYIPSFNNLLNLKNLSKNKNFKIIGSAHNICQLKNKELQGCEEIFITPLFPTKKNNYFLGINKFNIISKETSKKVISLGGITKNNFSKLKMGNIKGIASISWIKKNRPKNIGRFL